jgi:disulfide bond formation protein DsbB
MRLITVIEGRWPVIAGLISAAMLATAHVFQHLGYAPCNLCLRQREVYWGALALVAVGLVLTVTRRVPPRALALALGGVFLAGAIVAGFHAGVEWKWWLGPQSCVSTGASISAMDLTAILDGTAKVKPPACDEAAWRMAGLSMAGWNALISAGLAAISLLVAFGRQPETNP